MSRENEDASETLCSGETKIQEFYESNNCIQDSTSSCTSCQELEIEQDSSWDQSSLNHSLYIPNNHMTKSMLCLNEESQDEVSQHQMALKSELLNFAVAFQIVSHSHVWCCYGH